jgi:hypothetical protein
VCVCEVSRARFIACGSPFDQAVGALLTDDEDEESGVAGCTAEIYFAAYVEYPWKDNDHMEPPLLLLREIRIREIVILT